MAMDARAYLERFGHDWTDPEKVREYVERTDLQDAERREAFAYMAAFIPFERAAPIRILDIGSGHGAVAEGLLDLFPNGRAVGLDASEEMMAVGRERMARFGDRFSYQVGDFSEGALPADLVGPFEVAVASRAIHHVPSDGKRLLYKAIFRVLTPGGCFFNMDSVAPTSEELRPLYRVAARVLRGEMVDRNAPQEQRFSLPGHYYEPVGEQLQILTEAGFGPVDCFSKRLNQTLMGGYKPA
ncbi:MAG TPA: class I SAM-dependent methyltransferase [Chloroflexota bacterium]